MAKLDARLIATADRGRVVLQPVFSPDSGSLAFWSSTDQALKRVSVNGGAAVTICSADQPFGMSWDLGAITFAEGNKGIMRVAETGGTPVVIVSVKDFEQAHGPQILPGGDTVLYPFHRDRLGPVGQSEDCDAVTAIRRTKDPPRWGKRCAISADRAPGVRA